MDDSLANVMKTTQMTRKEVRLLYSDFRYLNTRTPRKQLLLLAEEAGRLGKKTRKDVMGFVEVANKIHVALGDDLGENASKAILEVGKLTNIFKVAQKYGVSFGQAMEMVGSAINEVAANSQAQAPFIIDFTKRLSGIAKQTKINTQDIIGYAATFDEAGQNLEMSATAINKVIVDMFQDTADYADLAGMSVSDFSNLLNTDANEAFIKVLESLNGNNEGFAVMAKNLDELGIDGARATQALASLAGNTNKLRANQALANKSLEEGTSLMQEYNVKNDNLAGSMEKIGRHIRSKFINSSFIGWLETVAGKMAKWIEIPLSKKLKKEQIEVNKLMIELTNFNTSAERRNTIYEQLKSISPDIVKGIDLENISVEKLRGNLAKYNEEMIRKIALQDSEEALADKREEAGEAAIDRLLAEEKLITLINEKKEKAKRLSENQSVSEEVRNEWAKAVEEVEKVLLSEEDLVKKAQDIRHIIKGTGQVFGITSFQETEFDKIWNYAEKVIELREDEKEAIQEVDEALKVYTDRYNKLMGITKKTGTDEDPSPKGKQPHRNKYGQTYEEWLAAQTDFWQRQEEAYAAYNNDDVFQLEDEQNVSDESEYLTEIYKNSFEGRKAILEAYHEFGKISTAEYNDLLYDLEVEQAEREIALKEQTENQKNEFVKKSIQAAKTLLGYASTAIYNKEIRDLKAKHDIEKEQLQKKFDQGLISKEKYDVAMDKLEQKKSKKELKLARAQAMREKAISALEIGVTTAKSIMQIKAIAKVYAAKVITAPLAAIALAQIPSLLGEAALNLGLVAAQPLPQYYKGRYPVIGASDGKPYYANNIGKPSTGIIRGPALISELEDEMIIDGPTTRNLVFNYPEILGGIKDLAMGLTPQFAEGRYPVTEKEIIQTETYTDPELKEMLSVLITKLDKPSIAVLSADENYINAHNEIMEKYNKLLSQVNG